MKTSRVGLTGPELSQLMKLGTRVARGADWKWSNQDVGTRVSGKFSNIFCN